MLSQDLTFGLLLCQELVLPGISNGGVTGNHMMGIEVTYGPQDSYPVVLRCRSRQANGSWSNIDPSHSCLHCAIAGRGIPAECILDPVSRLSSSPVHFARFPSTLAKVPNIVASGRNRAGNCHLLTCLLGHECRPASRRRPHHHAGQLRPDGRPVCLGHPAALECRTAQPAACYIVTTATARPAATAPRGPVRAQAGRWCRCRRNLIERGAGVGKSSAQVLKGKKARCQDSWHRRERASPGFQPSTPVKNYQLAAHAFFPPKRRCSVCFDSTFKGFASALQLDASWYAAVLRHFPRNYFPVSPSPPPRSAASARVSAPSLPTEPATCPVWWLHFYNQF